MHVELDDIGQSVLSYQSINPSACWITYIYIYNYQTIITLYLKSGSLGFYETTLYSTWSLTKLNFNHNRSSAPVKLSTLNYNELDQYELDYIYNYNEYIIV